MITLIMGHPNAGKTTYSEQYENVVHLDDYPFPKFLRCNEAASEHIGDVVIEGIYNLRCRREKLLEACSHHDRKVCIFLDIPADECNKRDTRGHIAGFLIPPTYDEGWDEIKVINERNLPC